MVKLRGLLLGVVFAAVAVGFAAAMPGAMSVSDVHPLEEETGSANQTETGEADAPKAVKSKADEKRAGEDGEQDGESQSDDDHGAVVSAVAKCDVKGRWHGEAVRSIARDKDATLADAEAACAAAKAAAAAAGGPGRSDQAKARAKGKPDAAGANAPKPPKPQKPTKPAAPPAPESQGEQARPAPSSGSGGGSGASGPPSSSSSDGPPAGAGKP